MIARLLLEDLKVDRIEIASARVSEGEAKAVKMICDWAARRGMLSRVEVLGFVDGNMSVDWIYNAGCRVINLLTKGSEKHCTFQLKKTLDQHLADILGVVRYAHGKGMDVNVYLEDWSNGIKDSPDYVFAPGRWTERLRNKTFHASRHLGGTGSVTGNRVHEEDEKMLSRLAFRFSCA